MEENRYSLTCFAPTIASVSDVEAPKQNEGTVVEEILSLVKEKTGANTVQKLLLYNPDAIGEFFFHRYEEKIFAPLVEATDLQVKFLSPVPPKTPVCFGTMYSGCSPDVHGIHKYEKPVLTVDTLFDSWARSGKKVALISKGGQSIPLIFANRNIDYFITSGDFQSVDKAIELMQNSDYDVIEVYNQEYDDMLHVTHPRSYFCKRAARHYVASYARLTEAVKTYWKDYTVLTSFSPDHGAHRIGGILNGSHGIDAPIDRHIVHFFSVYGGKNE